MVAAAASSSSTRLTITEPASIQYYNRGPATAVFTPPASCLSTLTFNTDMYFGHRGGGYVDTACYPASTTDRGSTEWDVYYYSPAQCPLGWAHAKTITGVFGNFDTVLTIGAATTVVVCCPSGYIYSAIGHQCLSSIASPTTSTLLYKSPELNGVNQWVSTSPAKALITAAAGDPYNVYGDGIPVWWQSSDLKAFAAATLPTSSTVTSSSSSSKSTATSSATSSGTPAPVPSTGLSSGAKIGLGVGIPLGIIAIGVVAFFLYFRRRGRQRIAQSESTSETAMNDMYKGPGELSGEATVVPELDAHQEPYDPYEPRPISELPAP